ncbi:Integrase catalytic domain-containing protein [Citrus sinensis]|uniref:Integrase catalytic domain-containing protein n=1 Tax=Citrus sinensis TaxID=2711 RepID=A0ACB8HV45_CITSI|nr:Integrase catalytic domain-containing protein [Citrus sinensis]
MIEEGHCVYVKRSKDDFAILSLYVDDILLAVNNKEFVKTVKDWLYSKFDIKDMGETAYILGVKIFRDRSRKLLTLSQEPYIKKILKRFNMADCKPMDTPIAKGQSLSLDMCHNTPQEKEKMARVPYANAIGSLMCAMMCTRPDISYTVGLVCATCIELIMSVLGSDQSWLCFSLLKSYENLVDALMYGRQTLTLDEVKSALNTRELQIKQVHLENGTSEGLTAKVNADNKKKKGKSKSKNRDLKCFQCHKECHFKRDCPEKKNKPKDLRNYSGDAVLVEEEGSESAGKSSRNNFRRSSHKSNERLDYAHSDLWGPVQCVSLGRNTYFLSIIDDFSRKVWVYVLKNKDKVFEKFKEWKQLVENQTGKRLKKLRTDNGLEFCNQPFDIFCTNEAYVHSSQGKLAPRALKGIFIDLIGFALVAAKDIDDEEPKNFKKVTHGLLKEEWLKTMKEFQKAMDEEMASLYKNKTWELVKKPENRRVVGCKWIFKIKEGINGSEPRRFKARLVAKGYTQHEGINFKEVFFPVVRHASIRVILVITAVQDMQLDQLDVKTTFLHGRLEEEILMSQPEGYLHEFIRCNYDCCIYYKTIKDGLYIYLILYVDDMLVACKDRDEIDKLKMLLNSEFEMKDLGYANKILGMEIRRNRKAEKQDMANVPYANAVGSLMYAMVLTRPDIAHVVSVVSRYMAQPGKDHWKTVKWILMYLNGTVNCGLLHGKTKANGEGLKGYIDSDYVGDLDRMMSLIGYIFMLNDCVVNWKLKCNSFEHPADHEKTKHIDVKFHFIRNEVSRGVVKMVKIHTDENPADTFTKWEDSLDEKYPHIVYHEHCKACDVEQLDPSSMEADGSDKIEEELVKGRSRVSWEKIDVSFHNCRQRFAAHRVTHVTLSLSHVQRDMHMSACGLMTNACKVE